MTLKQDKSKITDKEREAKELVHPTRPSRLEGVVKNAKLKPIKKAKK